MEIGSVALAVREPEKFANEKKVKNKGHESYISHVRVD
jgi:hypothetical protein